MTPPLNPIRLSVTRRAFLQRAAAASVVGPAVVAASGPSSFLGIAFAESADHSRQRDHLKLRPKSYRRKVETEHTVTAQVDPAAAGHMVHFLVIFGPNEGIGGVETTDDAGVAHFSYTGGPDEGTDILFSWIDDGNDVFDPTESFGLATVKWQLTHPIDKLFVSPRGGESEIGTELVLTATVLPPAPGIPIIFKIITGPHAGLEQTVETDENGLANFAYTGSTEGRDTIAILADANASGDGDEDELVAVVNRNWVIEMIEDTHDESHESGDESGDHSSKEHA